MRETICYLKDLKLHGMVEYLSQPLDSPRK